MGFCDIIYSTTDTMKRNAPDLGPVKNACRSSYDYSWTALAKVDNAVRVTGVRKLSQYFPDDEGRAKIGQFTKNFAKNAAVYGCHEGLKLVPGGIPVYNIVSRSLRDDKRSEDHKEEIKALRAKIGRQEKELYGCRKLLEQAEIVKQDVELKSHNALHLDSNVNQKPEDVISIFMMKEFMGRRFLDGLIVPGVGFEKNPKQKACSIEHA